MSKHNSTYPLARAAEVLAFYESPGTPEFPGAQPSIRINAEDFASVLTDVRSSLATHARLVEALEIIAEYTGDGGPGTPWRDIVRALGATARVALAAARGEA